MIKIADRSEYGWATVPAYVIDDLADTQDDERCISKAEKGWKAFEAKREKSRSRYTSFKSSNFASIVVLFIPVLLLQSFQRPFQFR